ncbi:MAG: hypothetical protein OXT09_18360, partial [Myxococcales bacterium]|nr:hypothetical protein [Myxococcales bacterium]
MQPSVAPASLSPRAVEREFRALLRAGAQLRCVGSARREPLRLLRQGYTPKYRIDLFGTRYYLSNIRQNPLLRFFVAYVVQGNHRPERTQIHPRIFYKDISLIWRSGSHLVRNDQEMWVGKGAVRTVEEGDWEHVETIESTTDLPFEMQTALEELSRKLSVVRRDEEVLAMVLRNAPRGRIAPYEDFLAPRRQAQARPGGRIHGGRPVARFTRRGDPGSLRFVAGYEPDFARGILEVSHSNSASYGGTLSRYRILSCNARIQYLFFAAPRHVWIIPPQALTRAVSSYGVRMVDVQVDDDMCLPGYEYHYLDDPDDPDSLYSQIPEGYAGDPNPSDPDRADASAWNDAMPVVQEFRQRVL